jgi:hypothetical protein
MAALKSSSTRPREPHEENGTQQTFSTIEHELQQLVQSAKAHSGSVSLLAAARTLGWAGIAIGLGEIAMPKLVERCLGIESRPEHRGVLRMLGVREIGHGLSILSEKRVNDRLATGIQSRVAGDVLDVALLGIAAVKTRHPARFFTSAAAVTAIGVADMLCASRMATR